MGDWLELCQAIIIGLVFSFLIAKLISVVISFKEDNLKVVHESDLTLDSVGGRERTSLDASEDVREGAGELEKEKESFLEDDSDWEGIESTELDDAFAAATAFVAATAADKDSAKVSNDVQLQLYGLYKIATEGPCTVPQPSALKMTARAKWNAWQRLGSMPPEEAMQKYIVIINELYPSWADHSTKSQKWDDDEIMPSGSTAKGSMGPVFSSFVHEEMSEVDLKLEAIHVFSREGQRGELLTHIANGASVNSRDSEGRTPLHWAVDRGHLDVVETLLDKNPDVNAKEMQELISYCKRFKRSISMALFALVMVRQHAFLEDIEGQTPLHYAALCDREEIGKLLVQHKADPYVKDNDDSSPLDLAPHWVFMTGSS